MPATNASSLTSHVNDWLTNSRDPRILHIFDSACNLINERREVLSIVTPKVGNGPFNFVVEDDVCFSEHVDLKSLVSASTTHLNLGDLTIHTAEAKLWNPQPDWEILHANRNQILDQLLKFQIMDCLKQSGLDTSFAVAQLYSTISVDRKLQITNYQFPNSLALADLPSSLTAAKQLAGLGVGLTPSADDFIMGALYAAWIIHPCEVAAALARAIANVAVPLTTSLSAAWLDAAGRGEAGILWHQLFEATLAANEEVIQQTINNILAVGETSGADALSGFFSTLNQIARPSKL